MPVINLIGDNSLGSIPNIIKLYKERGELSRVDVSNILNIPQPTITRCIDKLIKSNVLKETGYGRSSGGRRPILLKFNESCAYSIGVEIGRSILKVALTNLNGHILSIRMKVTNLNWNINEVLNYIKEVIDELLIETAIERSKVLGVGIGLPGPLMETESGYISPPNFYSGDIPHPSVLKDKFNFPVIIDKDANVAALSEKWFDKGIGFSNFAYVFADAGVGSAFIVNNDIYRGGFGEVGEIGHTTIDIYGEKCSCGNYGCLETKVSIHAIKKLIGEKIKLNRSEQDYYFPKKNLNELSIKDMKSAYHEGSSIVKDVFEEVGILLGVGVVNLINLVGPEIVILGGRVGLIGPIIQKAISRVVSERAIGIKGKKTPIILSNQDHGIVIGASALVIHNLFYPIN